MKHIFQISIAVFALVGLAACSQPEKKETASGTHARETYKLTSLTQKSLGGSLKLPGVMQPFEFVQLFPKVNGFVKDVNVDRGTEVRAGQVLLRLEAPELSEHAAAAKLKYMSAQTVFLTSKDRYIRLLETNKTPGAVSPYDLSAARAHMVADSVTVQGEWANYKATEDMMQYLVVTAPFDGVISERNVHPGALVGPGTGNKPMLVLQQQSKLRMTINVPEQYSMQIKDKDQVSFTVNALPGKTFTGNVARSSGSLSDNFRSEAIEVDVPNKDHFFKAGMYAEVALNTSGSVNAYVVPKTAIVTTTERKYIVCIDNQKAHFTDITEGNEQDGNVEIFGSFSPDLQIVANPSYKIKEGDRIAASKVAQR